MVFSRIATAARVGAGGAVCVQQRARIIVERVKGIEPSSSAWGFGPLVA